MTNLCKDVYHSIISAGHLVVHYQKCSFFSIKGATHQEVQRQRRYQIVFYIHRNKIGFVREKG